MTKTIAGRTYLTTDSPAAAGDIIEYRGSKTRGRYTRRVVEVTDHSRVAEAPTLTVPVPGTTKTLSVPTSDVLRVWRDAEAFDEALADAAE